MVVAEKVTGFTIPIFNGNKAKNLEADCISINLPKQNLTKLQILPIRNDSLRQ